jgi:hypothetical protein
MSNLPLTGLQIPPEAGGVSAFNRILATMDTLRAAPMKSSTNTPFAGFKAHGDRWNILGSPSGEWASNARDAAIWYQGWIFVTQRLGMGPTLFQGGANPGPGWWGNDGTTTSSGWQDQFTVT